MTLSNIIEAYLRNLLAQQNPLELRRIEVAQMFSCVPSQVTYVLGTRFSPEQGYLVESRRGGGGYVRIWRLPQTGALEMAAALDETEGISQLSAVAMVRRLMDGGEITRREAAMMVAAVDRSIFNLPMEIRDAVRSRLMRAMLIAVASQ